MKLPVDALTRTIAAALVALLVVAGCGQHDVESSAEAARADSSAAGYAVGERTDSDGGAGDTARRVAVAGTPNGGQDRKSVV